MSEAKPPDGARGSDPKSERLPPAFVIRAAWVIHRAIHRFTGGRRGLWPVNADKWGTMRLTTVGRRSGKTRSAILGYVEDGPNLVTLAMNGWMAPEPAWWLNLQTQPDAVIELRDGSRRIRARAAEGDERARLWDLWKTYGATDTMAARRPTETAIVVLEPRD